MFGFIRISQPPRPGVSIVASHEDDVMESINGDIFRVEVPSSAIIEVHNHEYEQFHFEFAFDESYVLDADYQEWAASRRRAKLAKKTGNVLEDSQSEDGTDSGDNIDDGTISETVDEAAEVPEAVANLLMRANLTVKDARVLARRRTKLGTALSVSCCKAGLTAAEYRVIYFYVIDD